MKTIRHYFYSLSLILSGGCLVLMALLILSQIGARALGNVIPSSEDFAGWLLSATIFFGLAYTFNEGGHIRVTMLLTRLSPKAKRFQEFLNLIVGSLISGYLAYYTIFTAYESYAYNDVSDTYLAVPLWIVQSPMAIGSLFLFIAIVDSLIDMIRNKTPQYIINESEISTEGAE